MFTQSVVEPGLHDRKKPQETVGTMKNLRQMSIINDTETVNECDTVQEEDVGSEQDHLSK